MGLAGRLLIALILVLFSVISYLSSSSYNVVTHEKQHISLSADQEIALGLQSAPEMAQQFGGLSRNQEAQTSVEKVGSQIIANSAANTTPYRDHFAFHVLADPRTINAFALPGGQVFITEGLFRLLRTPGELAGVLGHEVGHVVARHSAEHLAKQQLTQGLTGAATVAVDPTLQGARMAQMVASLITIRFGRQDELEADSLGLRLASEAGFDPRAMLGVMEILNQAEAQGRPPEFFSTHPNPENRAAKIQQELKRLFPDGVPAGLVK